MLIKLRRQQAELNSLREHTVAQLMALSLEGPNAKVSTMQAWGCACMYRGTRWLQLTVSVSNKSIPPGAISSYAIKGLWMHTNRKI